MTGPRSAIRRVRRGARRRVYASLRCTWLAGAMLCIGTTSAAAVEPAAPAAVELGGTGPDAAGPGSTRVAPRAPVQPAAWTVGFSASTRSLVLGGRFVHPLGFQTAVGTDAFLTPVLTGLTLDDLGSVRLVASETWAVRVQTAPWKLVPRAVGPRVLDAADAGTPAARPWPDLLFGIGVWGVLELDHVFQWFRQGDAGVYAGLSVGPTMAVAFSDVTLTLSYRPLSTSAFYRGGAWDTRRLAVANPVLDVAVVWTLPPLFGPRAAVSP